MSRLLHTRIFPLINKIRIVNTVVKKVLALAVMLAALVAIYEGIGYLSNYEHQTTIRTPYMQKSIVVQPKGYGVIALGVNESGDHDLRVSLNGTLREDTMPESFYISWINGSYDPPFSSTASPNNPGAGDFCPVSDYQGEPWYAAYWNVYSSDPIEVKMEIFRVSTETAYNYSNLGLGALLVATGAVAGLTAAFSISKRTMLVVISLTLVFSGALTVATYSCNCNFDKVVTTKTITVPANCSVTEPIHYNQTGGYLLRLTVNNGTMNATAMSSEQYGSFISGEYLPCWQKSRYDFGVSGGVCDGASDDAVLLLLNTDTYGKDVTVQFHCYWNGYDYAGLAGGAFVLVGGLAVFYFANRQQIKAFNKEIDAQK
jgi:hypothetical protein